MTPAVLLILRRWPIAALLASGAMLAIAHGFQTFGGLAPCTLCLRQRDVYWLALAVAAAGALIGYTSLAGRLQPAVCAGLAFVFLTGAGIAAYHAGAEWKWWLGPSACSGGGGAASAAGIAALLKGARVGAPRCDQAAWVWMGLSMAGWNVIMSLTLAVLSALAAVRGPRPMTEAGLR